MKKMFMVLEVLKEHGPLSAVELSAKMGMTREAVRSHITYLREKTPKVIYIHSWRRGMGYKQGRGGPLWAAGNAADAPRLLVRVRSRKTSLHMLKDDDRDTHLHNELKKRAKEIKPFRHAQDVAFFGPVGSPA